MAVNKEDINYIISEGANSTICQLLKRAMDIGIEVDIIRDESKEKKRTDLCNGGSNV